MQEFKLEEFVQKYENLQLASELRSLVKKQNMDSLESQASKSLIGKQKMM